MRMSHDVEGDKQELDKSAPIAWLSFWRKWHTMDVRIVLVYHRHCNNVY